MDSVCYLTDNREETKKKNVFDSLFHLFLIHCTDFYDSIDLSDFKLKFIQTNLK